MKPDTSGDTHHTSKGSSDLWTRFENAGSREEYFRSWLSLLHTLIPHTVHGILVMRKQGGESFEPVARWPEGAKDAERLAEIAERVLDERCGLLTKLSHSEGAGSFSSPGYGIAYPVLIDDDLYGAVAIEVRTDAEEELRSVMGQLRWGVSWLELYIRRHRDKEKENTLSRLKSGVNMLALVLSRERFDDAGMSFVTELATSLGCDRVSLGYMRGNHIRVRAISHSAEFGKRMNLVRAISRAMEEALIQRSEIVYPAQAGAGVMVTRDHEALAGIHEKESVLTIPLYGNGRYYGAVTFERPSEKPFEEEDVELCRSVSALAAPALEEKRLNDRLLIIKVFDSIKRQVVRLTGPGFAGRKLTLLLIAAFAVFFYAAEGEYRLSADTVLEGEVRRVVAAPFNGYIRESFVRAGDIVKESQLFCVLDDRDLRLERMNLLSQRNQFDLEYQEALAKHNRAEVKIIRAKLDQTAARLDLVNSKLDRTQISSPFEGVLVSGDLSQRLGGFVEQGEVLFEVAPLDAYRVILQVDESRITDVREGQEGQLILSSLPDEKFEFTVNKITPVTTAEEGRNYFRVEARLKNISESLRPGMEGVGKISIDRRKLVSIWTRGLMEWLRLWVWSWWP